MTTAMFASTRSVGSSVLRVEDLRILTGRGSYVDDKALPGMLHAAFLRSPFAHARILSIDTTAAKELEGVVAVYTGADMVERSKPLSPLSAPQGYLYEPVYALTHDKVRLVGDLVALVIAESRYIAEDALELIEVDFEPLEAIATFEQALDPDGPKLFENFGTNVIYESGATWGDVDGAFERADVVVSERFAQHRVGQMPMECRGGVADFDPSTGELTYYAATQSPHAVRDYLATALDLDREKVRVLNGDIGGSFGLKIGVFREDLCVNAAAVWLGRPVKWTEDRNEHLLASSQAREDRIDVEAAVLRDGTILALRTNLIIDVGAYAGNPIPMGGLVDFIATLMPGPYTMGGFEMKSKVVCSNKATYGAYRAPWAVETWARERMINVVAAELGLDPAEVRLKNFAANDGSAHMVTGRTLLGTYAEQSLRRALEVADYEQFRADQVKARAEGRCVGIGFATFIEAAPGPRGDGDGSPLGEEKSIARIEPDGSLIIFTTQAPHGQGHETTLAQIASDELGIPFDRVTIVHGDTQRTPWTLIGTGGSRSATMASGSVLNSTREVKRRALQVAAELLEASPEDLVIEEGLIHPAGIPAVSVTLAEVATRAVSMTNADGEPLALEVEFTYDGGPGGWVTGTHLAEVEIDLETGHVEFLRYIVAEDCGKMINPAIVEGQIRGGVAQGVGEVLYEWSAYDETGNFLAGTFMDYLLPTAAEVPNIEIAHLENEPNDEVSYRGVGEGGLLIAPAAINNAIEDALSPYGVRLKNQYLPPSTILELAGVIKTAS